MKPLHETAWMETPIENTTLTQKFKITAKQKGYNTIGELLTIEIATITEDHWLSDAMIAELPNVVKQLRSRP